MNILILGAGALGSLVGARLSQTDSRVLLLSTNRQHMEQINRHGLQVEELDGSVASYALPAYFDPRSIEIDIDLVLVTVKSYSTSQALPGIAGCTHPATCYLTLQNGIGNWEQISRAVGEGAVLAGSTAQGATFVEPGRIRHGGQGMTTIGEFTGKPSERVRQLVKLFLEAGLEAQASDRMQHIIMKKLVVNVGINAITALTAIRNGGIADGGSAQALCTAAVEEALAVLQNQGFTPEQDMPQWVLTVARATAANRSSMGQDVDRRKRTEIDAINGAIVELGRQAQIPTPVNWTLTQLVKTLEAGYANPHGGAKPEPLHLS